MSLNEKRMFDRETLRSVIQQWNTVRLDIFALSEPNENLEFHGVMRFYFQDEGQKVATKCIRVASDATVSDVIETLIEKFRPDMRMLSLPNYALYVVHANGEERKLNPDEKPLLVQLNWHNDDREGRFLLKNCAQKTNTLDSITDQPSFKRKLSKREKKEQKKKEKLNKLQSGGGAGGPDSENHVAEKLYTELPETSFTRSISNPEAVMRRRRQQKLEKKLQQFRSRDGGPDTGGTLKIYGESLCRDVPYKTLLLSIRDCAQAVVREMLSKYGMDKVDPLHYCLVQVNSDGSEYILDDDECPLSILMNHPTSRGSIMFHVRRRPADSQPRRRKKKPLGVANGGNNIGGDREGPMLIEITHSGDGGRRVKLGSEPIEVGSANTNALQLFGPSIQARHCLISMHDGVCTVTPLHADGTTFVNGHHIQQPTILHNGSVVMFGRVASYRFVDSPSDGRYNLALSQSQLDSACLYESRSPTSPTSWNEEESRPISPISSVQTGPPAVGGSAVGSSFLDNAPPPTGAEVGQSAQQQQQQHHQQHLFAGAVSQQQQQQQQQHQTHSHMHRHHHPSGLLVTALDGPDAVDEAGGGSSSKMHSTGTTEHGEGDLGAGSGGPNGAGGAGNGGETETKSISSYKSIGSTTERTSTFPKLQPSHAATSIAGEPGGQEPILPAVLEFPEQNQEPFLQSVISELDVNSPNFKLAPVYTLYLCARYRASTHYRPDLQPTERAHKLTVFLYHVANLIQNVVQEQYTDAKILSFWMANSSEFLHFLKSDRHISAFSVQAQEVLAESVQTAFRNLVSIFHVELSQTLNQFLSENIDHDSAAGLVLSVLGSAMALLRRCRVNAALTIQLFSQLFHYINVVCFNKFVTTSHMCTSAWGKALSERLSLLELWAEKQGLELAADCHLAKINQCAQFLQAPKTSVPDVQQLACSCFRLNSLQMAALLSQETIPRNLIDTAVRMAESVADELSRADGREIRLEESPELPLALLLPDDGFSCDVVRGIPAGLVDFLNPFQMAGWCRLASQPTSIGLWTVYMHQFNQGRSPSVMSSKLPQPEVQIIKLHKNANGMGLSIVAAKGAGQERLGIYIKSVVGGGAADIDGRLQAGDQLLEVDGQSLIGITQERAADHLVRTGPIVTLKVAKQGAIYHGLATLLQQPSPVIQREMENEFNCNVYDNDGNHRYHFGRSNESLNFYGSGGGSRQSRRGSLRQPLSSTPMINQPYSNSFLTQNDASYRRMSNPDICHQRRYSLSLSNEDILSNDQLQQIHFDPRYRDCRSSTSLNSIYYNHQQQQYRHRSNSLNSIGRIGAGFVMPPPPPPVLRYDTPPSIYVEDYDTRSNSHSSREMIKIEEAAEPETPVAERRSSTACVFEIRVEAPSTESNLSFVADVNLDDIPFIDEDDGEVEDAPGSRSRGTNTTGVDNQQPVAPPPPPPVTVVPSGTSLPSIMINAASRRGSNASCRKTVSFDIINDHHPYDDSDESEGAEQTGKSNIDFGDGDECTVVGPSASLASRVANRLNNNSHSSEQYSGGIFQQRRYSDIGSPSAAVATSEPLSSTTYSNNSNNNNSNSNNNNYGITDAPEYCNNNDEKQDVGREPQKSINVTAPEPKPKGSVEPRAAIDTIRDYVVRHFSGTANINVNNNYYCSNNTADRRKQQQRSVKLDSEASVPCPRGHPLHRERPCREATQQQQQHFATDSNNERPIISATPDSDDDHCKLLRNIQLLKADGTAADRQHYFHPRQHGQAGGGGEGALATSSGSGGGGSGGTKAEDTSIGNPPAERSRLHAHLGVLKSPTIERKPENHRRPPSSSMANNFHAALHGLNPHVLPDAFMLRKVQRCRPDCSNIENQPVALSFLYGARLSSPSSSSASCPDLGTSPGVRQTTPRQLKKQHNILRLLRQINGKLDGNVDTTAPTAAVVDDDESSSANKSRSIHNLAGGGGVVGAAANSQDQGFYQNLSVYRAQNQSHPNLGER
ncbi:AGAP004039-PA-like protein [Anopheles sinensis]|uniref:AGAP004039-PA-like protein n=1 Tax=Anopheles sinensis TaxID=74873 RepID=A0A084VTJ5_ANOSI|nr:AGAP004039-PA-like protein [Anopheles sinensis]